MDAIAPQITAGNIKILLDIYQAPQWAWGLADQPKVGSGKGPILPPGDDSTALAWWKQFVHDAVAWFETRYGKSGLAGVEMWNEENTPTFWDTTLGLDATRYSKLLCQGFWGSWSADASLPVIYGGLGDNSTGTNTDTTYLQSTYHAGQGGTGSDIRGCMSSIGIDPYNYDPVNKNWVAPSQAGYPFANAPSSVSQIACTYGDCNRPISITEFGYPVPPVVKADQASWDSQAYSMASTTPNVNMLLIFSLFNTWINNQGDQFGVCFGPLPNGSPNTVSPAANALKQTISGNPSAQATC